MRDEVFVKFSKKDKSGISFNDYVNSLLALYILLERFKIISGNMMDGDKVISFVERQRKL